MTNKIGSGGIDTRSAQVSTDRGVKRTQGGSDSAAAAEAKSIDTSATGVRITDSARQLAALEAAIRDLPDVDEAKVAKARAAIADGSYRVSPDRIAEKLLRIEGELQ